MNEALLRGLVTVLSGSLAGGLTNTVAIWMLFHPYRPPRLFGLRLRLLQGVVPKNQERLARAIGGAVGNRLLTEDDLTRVLAEPEFRDAFDHGLARFLEETLEAERPSLRELLGPEGMASAQPIIDDVLSHAVARVEAYLGSPAFEEQVRGRSAALAELVADRPVSDLMPSGSEAGVAGAVAAWIESWVANEAFRASVADYLDEVAGRLLRPDATLRELLPDGMAPALKRAIAGYVPLVARRLGSLLDEPATRTRVEKVTRDLLDRFLRDLRFHQRLVARLVINDETVARIFSTLQAEGADRIAGLFREADTETATARRVGEAVADLMDRPVTDVLGEADDPAIADTIRTLADSLVTLAREPSTTRFLADRVEQALTRASDRTWGDLLHEVPQERVAGWIVSAARSDIATGACRDGVRRLANAGLDRPIGRPADLLPEGAIARIREAVSEPLWQGIQGQIPALVRRLDVARRVEEKVAGYPVERMEKLVRRVTDRELRTIVYLGYALGAFVGLVLLGLNALWG